MNERIDKQVSYCHGYHYLFVNNLKLGKSSFSSNYSELYIMTYRSREYWLTMSRYFPPNEEEKYNDSPHKKTIVVTPQEDLLICSRTVPIYLNILCFVSSD
jgi:hypothetical protein